MASKKNETLIINFLFYFYFCLKSKTEGALDLDEAALLELVENAPEV